MVNGADEVAGASVAGYARIPRPPGPVEVPEGVMTQKEAPEILKAKDAARLEVFFEGSDGVGELTEVMAWDSKGSPLSLLGAEEEAAETLARKALALVPQAFEGAGGWGMVRINLPEDEVEVSYRHRGKGEKSAKKTVTLEDLERKSLLIKDLERKGLPWKRIRQALQKALALVRKPQSLLAEGLLAPQTVYLPQTQTIRFHQEEALCKALGKESCNELLAFLVELAYHVSRELGLYVEIPSVAVRVGEENTLVLTLEWTEWEEEGAKAEGEMVRRKGQLSRLLL